MTDKKLHTIRRAAIVATCLFLFTTTGLAGDDDDDDEFDSAVVRLADQEDIRKIVLTFADALNGDATLSDLFPSLAPDFQLIPQDFLGNELGPFGVGPGLQMFFQNIVQFADPNLLTSAIDVEVHGSGAEAKFRFANSVNPSVVLGCVYEGKILVFADNHAYFEKQHARWKLKTLRLEHTLVVPSTPPICE